MSSEAGFQKNGEGGGLFHRDSILEGLPTLLGEMFFACGGAHPLSSYQSNNLLTCWLLLSLHRISKPFLLS